MIRDISIMGDVITLTLALKSERSLLKDVLITKIEEAVGSLPDVSSIQVIAHKVVQAGNSACTILKLNQINQTP